MKKALFLTLFLAVASMAAGQQYPTAEGGTVATSIGAGAFPLLAPDGTPTAPSYSFTNDTDMGLRLNGSNVVLQNAATAALGQATLILGPTYWDLIAYQVGDATDFGNVQCYNNAGDTECFFYVTDGTNTSQVDFLNDGTTFSDPAFLPDGVVGAVALAFESDTGIFQEAADEINFALGGSERVEFNREDIYISASNADGAFASQNTKATATQRQWNAGAFTSGGAKFVQIGAVAEGLSNSNHIDLTAGPTANQTVFEVQGGSGTQAVRVERDNSNTLFAHWDLENNYYELSEDVVLQFEGATGDTNETQVSVEDPTADRFITIPDEGITTSRAILATIQNGVSTLTDGSATNILSFPLASSVTDFIAGTVILVTECTDTTNTIYRHDTVDFICKNISDTEACAFQTNLGSALDLVEGTASYSSHTLAADSSATNTVEFTLNANCSLTPTTLQTSWEIEFHHPDWEAVTELN
jgi:hypothetical protein